MPVPRFIDIDGHRNLWRDWSPCARLRQSRAPNSETSPAFHGGVYLPAAEGGDASR